MFARLKLKSQMLLGYVLPVGIYLGVAGMVFSTANQVFETFKEVERVQNVLLGANNLAFDTQGMIRSFRGYLIDGNEQFLKEYQDNLRSARESAQELKPIIVISEQQTRVDQMLEQIDNYDKAANEMLQLIQQGKHSEAIDIFKTGRATEFVKTFDEIDRAFKDAEEAALAEDTQQATAALKQLTTVLIWGTLVLIGMAVAIALLISSSITKTINQAVSTIATSSTEIATTITQQERTSSQQATSVNQTTTTMDELGASSRQSAEQAESAASGAKTALAKAEDGTKAVGQTLEGMTTLKVKVEAIAEQILRLSEQTNQISSITGLVSDLANQTNMLALNAAVEAARAGDHGKGFAVVAVEIRKLADQSKKSAEKINALVNDIQTAINSTVMVTDEGTKTVETGMQIAQSTADAFGGVTDAVNNVFLSTQQISLNAKQQAVAIEQVVDAMNALNIAAKETVSGIAQTKIGTQRLNDAALNLQSIV